MEKLLEQAIKAIDENVGSLFDAYLEGKRRAMYNKGQAGIQKAFGRLNIILPDDFRKNISVKQAMFLNNGILVAIRKKADQQNWHKWH